MSLILEALKKSEANRRLGSAPDLATPFGTARRTRSSPLFLAVILIAAAALLWWWLRPASPPSVAPESATSSTQPAKPSIKTEKPVAHAALPAQRRSAPTRPVGGPPAVAMPPPPGAAQFGPLPPGMAPPGADLASRPPHRSNPVSIPRVARNAAAPPAPTMRTATNKTATTASTQVRAPKTADTRGFTPPPTVKTDTPRPETKTAPVAPPLEADVTPYYALAFAVRKELPPLKLSMHVYAADPKQRFVILNDSRMSEGDSSPDGLDLRSIRPDGVILEFKGQQFFYPRDGW
jgi:general secretion pathway protein B